MFEIGSRERTQPPPPHVVWQSLVEPRQPGTRVWLDLLGEEVAPKILRAAQPSLVVWSSIWPSRAADTIRFDLRPDGSGTALRWTVLTADPRPDASKTGHLRYRMNVLVNERLRFSYGQ